MGTERGRISACKVGVEFEEKWARSVGREGRKDENVGVGEVRGRRRWGRASNEGQSAERCRKFFESRAGYF